MSLRQQHEEPAAADALTELRFVRGSAASGGYAYGRATVLG